MITKRTIASVAAAAVALLTVSGPTAVTAGPAGADLAEHVRMMAQSDMGIDGTHNPGMHQGLAGMEAHHS